METITDAARKAWEEGLARAKANRDSSTDLRTRGEISDEQLAAALKLDALISRANAESVAKTALAAAGWENWPPLAEIVARLQEEQVRWK
jgi:hypothetical protein